MANSFTTWNLNALMPLRCVGNVPRALCCLSCRETDLAFEDLTEREWSSSKRGARCGRYVTGSALISAAMSWHDASRTERSHASVEEQSPFHCEVVRAGPDPPVAGVDSRVGGMVVDIVVGV